MSVPTEQKVWILANPPAAELLPDTFSLETRPLPDLQEGDVLIQVEYLSNDPAQRGWMQKDVDPVRIHIQGPFGLKLTFLQKRLYVPPVYKGDAIRATGIARVLKSKSAKYPEGSRVTGSFAWYDYAVVNESKITGAAIELPNKPYASLSVFGMTSVTAYQGIFDVLDVKPEHTVIVSGAAG